MKICIISCILILCSGFIESGAKQGVLDLRNWNPEKDGPVELAGEWEFYWKQFPEPEEFAREEKPELSGYITLPEKWNGYTTQKGEQLSGPGYATYRLIIHLPYSGKMMALKTRVIRMSYTLYVNGKEIGSNGKTGTSAQTSVPELRPQLLDFQPEGNRVEILLRVSNFHHFTGGPLSTIILGPEVELHQAREKKLILEFFLLGSILIMGLYHLIIYLLRREDRSFLYFSLTCFLVSVYLLYTNEIYFTTLFPGISWQGLHYISFATEGMLCFAFALFMRSLFPNEFPGFFIRIIEAVLFIFIIITIIVPIQKFGLFYTIRDVLIISQGGYIVYRLFISLIRKKEGAGLVLLGGVILFITLVNDILAGEGLIKSVYLFPAGLFLFLFSQVYILSTRYSKAFEAVERFSSEMEQKVGERTLELKEANEKLRDMDRAKTNLFTNISHELRTPLTLLVSPIESILQGDYGNAINRDDALFTAMHRNGIRLLELINNLLDFSKIDANRMEVKKTRENIPELLKFYVSGIHSAASTQKLQISFRDTTEGILAWIDRDLLDRALYNLISNAMKFTPPGGDITLTLEREKESFSIIVEDTGIGIPEDKLDAIFERFTQVDSSLSRKYDGTGIGLSLTKEIVDLHNGMITVESTQGKGSKFTITLPIEHGPHESPGENKEDNKETNTYLRETTRWNIQKEPEAGKARSGTRDTTGRKRTILIVDDNTDMLIFLRDILEREYAVIQAGNGREALRQLRKNSDSIDLVLSDVMMPEMDGYELTAAIRRDQKFEGLPIILLTARADTAMKVEGILKGANDYISKPFNTEELLARVRSQVELKDLRDRLITTNERLKHTLEDSSILVSHVAHKFHNLLWPFAQLLLLSREFFEEMENMNREEYEFAAETLERCRENMDKIEHMKMQLKQNFGKTSEKAEISLYRVLETLVNKYQDHCRKETIVLEWDCDIDTESMITINREQVNIALENIMNNAIQAIRSQEKIPGAEKKEKKININAWYEHEYYAITIEDTGPGMPPKLREKIFNKFYTSKEKEIRKGLGLGLHLTQWIVTDSHKGKIEVESEEGAYTRFTILLPEQGDML
ncbi:MAG: response regulator [bacterium]|nr:response regulator [bacterium]